MFSRTMFIIGFVAMLLLIVKYSSIKLHNNAKSPNDSVGTNLLDGSLIAKKKSNFDKDDSDSLARKPANRQPPNQKAIGESRNSLKTLSISIDKYWANNDSVAKTTKRSLLMESLYNEDSSGYQKLSSRILTEPQFTNSLLGERQAIGRIFAIQFLIFSAQRDGNELIRETIKKLSQMIGKSNSPKGIELDLKQLLSRYIKINTDYFLENYPLEIDSIEVNRNNIHIIDSSIGLALLGKSVNSRPIVQYIYGKIEKENHESL